MGDTASPGPPGPSYDAIIFVPGCVADTVAARLDQSIDGIARRIAVAVGRATCSTPRVEPTPRDLAVGSERVCAGRVIHGLDPASGVDAVHVVALDYEALLRPEAPRNPLMLTLGVAGKVMVHGARVAAVLLARDRRLIKDAMSLAQILFILFMASLVCVYMVAVAVGAVATIWQAIGGREMTWPPLLLSLGAVAMVLVPGIGTRLRRTGELYLAFADYIGFGVRRNVIAGLFDDAVAALAMQPVPPRRIHIISFSFGSVVALDSIFPQEARRPFPASLETVVTVGCPFDLIRLIWPRYFKDREPRGHAPPQWLNIYAPVDVIGSNFRDDAELGPAECGIALRGAAASDATVTPVNIVQDVGTTPRDLSALGVLTVWGVRAHALYWITPFAGEISCFDAAAARMFSTPSRMLLRHAPPQQAAEPSEPALSEPAITKQVLAEPVPPEPAPPTAEPAPAAPEPRAQAAAAQAPAAPQASLEPTAADQETREPPSPDSASRAEPPPATQAPAEASPPEQAAPQAAPAAPVEPAPGTPAAPYSAAVKPQST